ncbi:MAG: carboxypeptidase-like regulatory domain-containing protein [Bacteroidota bacterium]
MDPFKSNIDHLTPELMQRYLDDSLSREERHEVEKLMAESDFESEAIEGFQSTKLNLEKDLTQLNQNLTERIKKEKQLFPLWFKIAASALIIAASTVLVINYDFNSDRATNKISSTEKEIDPDVTSGEEKPSNVVITDSLLALNEKVVSTPTEADDSRKVGQQHSTDGKNEHNLEEIETIALAETEIDELAEEELEIVEDEYADIEPTAAEPLSSPMESRSEGRKESLDFQQTIAKENVNKLESRSKVSRSLSTEQIKGQVTSADDGEPLPGVNIILKGTSIGTVSDMNGNFSIDLEESSKKTLVASYIGFSPQEVNAGEQPEVDFELSPDVSALSEVVVTGYGIAKKKQRFASRSNEKNRTIISAKPAGGKLAYKKYLQENIIRPRDSLSVKVTVKFQVLPDGTLTNFEVSKVPNKAYREEAIRLIKSGPKWIPASENDSLVTDEVKVKVRFR